MTDSNPGWPWAVAIAFAAVAGSLVTACLMPFVAVAVMAAATLPPRSAIATILIMWLANQAIGFGLLAFPLDSHAIGWGLALGGGALIAWAAARMAGVRPGVSPLGIAAGGALAFAAYEVALYGFALVAGGTGTFTPAIIALLARNEAIWLAALWAFHQLLARTAPGWFGVRTLAA